MCIAWVCFLPEVILLTKKNFFPYSCIVIQLAFHETGMENIWRVLETVVLPFIDRVEPGYLDRRVYKGVSNWFFVVMTKKIIL